MCPHMYKVGCVEPRKIIRLIDSFSRPAYKKRKPPALHTHDGFLIINPLETGRCPNRDLPRPRRVPQAAFQQPEIPTGLRRDPWQPPNLAATATGAGFIWRLRTAARKSGCCVLPTTTGLPKSGSAMA